MITFFMFSILIKQSYNNKLHFKKNVFHNVKKLGKLAKWLAQK
jgi:hypothetical protein